MVLEKREALGIGIITPPEIVLENARTAAKALADVISKKKKPVIMNGEQYLEFEDWQTVGQFYGYTVRTHHAEAVEVDGVKGARAEADLVNVRTGEVTGGAEAYCMRDEEHWNTRPKYEWQGEGKDRKRVKVSDEIVPWFQLASMAQTRAGAKALRNRLAWVVVLAGYRPFPAEEMTEGTISEAVQERRTVDKTAHYCPIHDVNFFKKGKMQGYAHPIEGTKDWCNEETQPQAPTSTSETSTAGASEKEGSDNLPTETEPAPKIASVEPIWLKETLDIINWTPLTAVKWINAQFGLPNTGKSVSLTERVNALPIDQLKKFVEHIRAMREASGK